MALQQLGLAIFQPHAPIGHHHHIAGGRADGRRTAIGEQVSRLASLAMKRKPSVDFSSYG
jgi:hypothetical protein